LLTVNTHVVAVFPSTTLPELHDPGLTLTLVVGVAAGVAV